MKLPTKKRKKKKPPPKRCRWVRDKRTKRRRKVCKRTPPKRRTPARRPAVPAPQPKPQLGLPVPSAAAPAIATTIAGPAEPPAIPAPPRGTLPEAPVATQPTFGPRQAERLLWRAGFGPRPGDVERLASLGLQGAVHSLTRVSGPAPLTGTAPRDQNGNPIAPEHVWGHDHLWWLDRMVRSEHQLVERMTLVWHDWFATTQSDVGNQRHMLDQNELFRRHALGSFEQLALDVTVDKAMLRFLNGLDNRRGRPNENYARELMELFTLGADRGAYTETDVRELARALTGWRADWVPEREQLENFRFDPNRHDTGSKTLWDGTGHTRRGAFGWQDAVRLCLENPYHRSFFVRKLWSYFIPTAPDAGTQAALEAVYWNSGYQVRPVLEAILMHPDLYEGAPLVKPPAVLIAGLLRLRNRPIDTNNWAWRSANAGQQLFHPPNVSGWNDAAWLDTATIRGRWDLVYEVLNKEYVSGSGYSTTETVDEAIDKALAFWGRPALTSETLTELHRYAAAAIPAVLQSWERGSMRANRQNALRHLIATCPDFQTC